MTFPARPRHFSWSITGLGLGRLLLGSFLGLQGMTSAPAPPSAAPARAATVEPRLIVHQEFVPFAGTITGGATVAGTVRPSLPGMNTLSLRILLPGRRAAQGGTVTLALSMPGMAMLPEQATLTASGGSYRGSVVLPMFGRYRARVAAVLAGDRYTGSLGLVLPLTLASLPASKAPTFAGGRRHD
jgi:hypothetical protein